MRCLSRSAVSAAEIVVVLLVAEHEVGGGQHGGGNRHDGLLRATATLQAPKLRLDSFRSSGSRPMRPGPAPSSARESRDGPGSSGACPHSGRGAGQARPRDQMARTGKSGHVHTDLGDDHPCDRLTDTGHRRQPVGGVAKRAQDLVGLVLDLLHGGGQRADLRQVQLQQEPMMRPTVHRGDDLHTIGLQAPVGQSARRGIGLPATIAAGSPG